MNKTIKSFLLGIAMLSALPMMAQNKVVTGTVIDELGEPVIGATVRVEGTKTATVTDFDGNYKLEVPQNGKVVISYIGYKDTPTTGGKVQLETNNTDLQEVVVVGYGVQKKAHLTGSVGTVDMNDVQDLAGGSLGSTLSGLVNGLSVAGGDSRPGERAELYVRDARSLASLSGNVDTNTSPEPFLLHSGSPFGVHRCSVGVVIPYLRYIALKKLFRKRSHCADFYVNILTTPITYSPFPQAIRA